MSLLSLLLLFSLLKGFLLVSTEEMDSSGCPCGGRVNWLSSSDEVDDTSSELLSSCCSNRSNSSKLSGDDIAFVAASDRKLLLFPNV